MNAPAAPEHDLRGPFLRMAEFFVAENLPRVDTVRDVFEQGRALVARGIPVAPTEAHFLRQVAFQMLQIQDDQLESDNHAALARAAALALAIIEDDDFTIPEGYGLASPQALDALAIELKQESFQRDMSVGVCVGTYNLNFTDAAGLEGFEERVPERLRDERFSRALNQIRIHLRQGGEILAKQSDPERKAAHAARYEAGCMRARNLLARLLAFPPQEDHPVVRAHIVRRELKQIEVDALGAQRISEAEQAAQAAELLAWTEQDLGEELTDENKAQIAARIEEAAREELEEEDDDLGGVSGIWLFQEES